MTKKTRILNTATRLLALKGYKETSMAELASLSGVAQGTIFYHFHNKETLFLCVLKHFQTELDEALRSYEETQRFSNGLEGLLKKVEAYFLVASKLEDEFLLIHRHDAFEITSESDECRNMVERIYDRIVDFFEQAVMAGQQDGSIVPSKARNTAMILFAMADGLVRFKTYGIYETGVLYEDFMDSIRRIVGFVPS